MLKKKCTFLFITLVCSMIVTILLTWYAIGVSLPVYDTYLNQPLPFSRDLELIRYFNKRGFELSVLPNKSRLWTQDIQLCIMFNSVHHSKTVGLLLSYYLQFFDHITLLFNGAEGTLKKPRYAPETVQSFGCDSYYGWYQHKCLSICLSHADVHVKGFLYVADDMFINIAKMGELDPSRLWYLIPKQFNYSKLMTMNKFALHRKWYWFGYPFCNEVRLKKVIDNLPDKWIEQLKQNAGFPGNFQIIGNFDIIYIPKSLASSMIQVITFITNTTPYLFSEIAGPLAVGIVSHPSQRVLLSDAGSLWDTNRTLSIKREKAKMEHFVHPIKVGKGTGEAKLWQELMREQMKAAAATLQ